MDARVLLPSLRAAAWGALLTCAALLALLPDPAAAVEVRVESPAVNFDKEANRYTYREARLTLGGLVLFAEHLEVLVDRRLLRAEGFLRLRNGPLFGDAKRLELSVDTGAGTLEDVNLFDTQTGYYLQAARLRIQADGTLVATECRFTACPPGTPGWRLDAGRMAFYPQGQALAHRVVLRTGPVPVALLPLLAWPTGTERASGVLPPRISRETSSLDRLDLGLRLQVPVFIDLGLEHDLTVTPEWVQRRGTALGLEYNYAFTPGQRGRLSLWGIREWHTRVPSEENVPDAVAAAGDDEPIRPQRWRVDYGHNQRLTEAGRLVLRYAHASDGQVRREYEGVQVDRPYRSGQAGLTWQSGWGDLGLTYLQDADYTDESVYADSEAFTDLHRKPQLLPRLTYRAAARPWDAVPLSAGLHATATRFLATDAVSGRVDTASPSLALPVPLGGAFELRPSVTRHYVRYSGLGQGDPTATEPLADEERFAQTETELELRTTLARTYGGDEDTRLLKHRLTPRLIYRTLEDTPQPLTDEVLRARPALRLVTLRLDSTLLEGRRRPGEALPSRTRELAWLDVIQRYNLLFRDDSPTVEGPPLPSPAETEPGEPLLPAIIEGGVNGQGYRLAVQLNYHHQLARVTESIVSLQGRVAPRTALGIGYRYNEFGYFTPEGDRVPRENTFTFNGTAPLAGDVAVGWSGRLNMQDEPPPLDRRLDQAQAFLDFRSVCYSARVTYAENVDSTVENRKRVYFVDRRILFTFTLTGLQGGGAPQGFTLWQN